MTFSQSLCIAVAADNSTEFERCPWVSLFNQNQIDQVLMVLQQQGKRCSVEKVMEFCSDLTEDQVFLAIDYLIRTDQVCRTLDANWTSCVPVSYL